MSIKLFIIRHNMLIGGRNQDCLNTVRLLAAIQVLYGHTIHHLQINPIPIFDNFINFFNGVPIFFTLSGYLIWWSIGKSRSYGEYLKKRFWRIYPELWIAVFVEILVIVAIYNKPIEWPQLTAFAVTQSTFLQFWTPDFLRGYGCGCPNGALWTICILIQFYIFSYFIYKGLHKRKLWLWIIVILVSICISLMSGVVKNNVPEIASKLYSQTLIPYLWMFLCAALVAEKKDMMLPFLKKYYWCGFVVVILLKNIPVLEINASYPVFETIFLFLGLIGFAYSYPKINIKTDISYPIYIYHMTLVNALITFEYYHNAWLFVFVLVLTCVLAWFSTNTIGRWSMRMKNKFLLQRGEALEKASA